jgi:CubicO group peptidase (beta-lactamase class C family)
VAALAIEDGNIQGLVVAVAQNGSVAFERGYGLADVQGNVAMTDSSVVDYFSIGKHITAAILLRLAERGDLHLDSPANLYLPEADFEGADVTVRQLLSHTSGLWEDEKDEDELPSSFGEPPPEGGILEWANQGKRFARPGETWMYSNGGYLFAGEIAEHLSGETLENLIETELAAPLGLEFFGGCANLETLLASGYSYENGEARLIADIDARWWGGSGNVCGTAGDLMRWWLALRSGRVIGAASGEQMFSPIRLHRRNSQAEFGYGLGIRIGNLWGHVKIGHTGSGSGGTAVLAEYPDESLVILTIVNTAGDGVRNAAEVEAEIAARLLGADTSTAERVPIHRDLLTAAPGHYRSPAYEFCISARGTELWRSVGTVDAEQMRHSGNGKFTSSNGKYGVSVEYFLGTESGKAQWFGYDYNGFPQDLAVRVGDECG